MHDGRSVTASLRARRIGGHVKLYLMLPSGRAAPTTREQMRRLDDNAPSTAACQREMPLHAGEL